MFSRIKGAQDLLSYNLWKGVLRQVENHFKSYNFKEIQTPLLEYVSLFERGLGYETEVVKKQMFLIEQKTIANKCVCVLKLQREPCEHI